MATKYTPKIYEVKAFARYIHVSPQKLRLVANLIRQTPVDTALEQLRFSSKNAAVPLAKAINSAIANAIHNFDLKRENLFVKAVTIDGGPVYKTYNPRAQGRAFELRKRTSHINVVLGSREHNQKKKTRSIFSLRPKLTTEEVKKPTQQETGHVDNKSSAPKQPGKPEEKMKQQKISLKRRLFNRRTGP